MSDANGSTGFIPFAPPNRASGVLLHVSSLPSLDNDQFCVDQAHWLDDYALLRALKARHGGAYYLRWPEEFVRREPAALAPSTARPGGTDRTGSIHAVPVVPPGQVPLQDLLNLGAEARMNLPGSVEGNRCWRCTDEILPAPLLDRLRDLTTSSNRR